MFLALVALSFSPTGGGGLLVWPVRCAAAALTLVATLDALRLRSNLTPRTVHLPLDTAAPGTEVVQRPAVFTVSAQPADEVESSRTWSASLFQGVDGPPFVPSTPDLCDWKDLALPQGWSLQPSDQGTGMIVRRPQREDIALRHGKDNQRLSIPSRLTTVVWTPGPDQAPQPTTLGWAVTGSADHLVSLLEVL